MRMSRANDKPKISQISLKNSQCPIFSIIFGLSMNIAVKWLQTSLEVFQWFLGSIIRFWQFWMKFRIFDT